jgi:hypothetical protein
MSATAFFAELGRVSDAMELFRPGHLNRHDWRATANLAGVLAEADPSSAAEWFSSIPEEVNTGPAARALMTSWISRDPAAARNWLESMPPGLHRDEAARVAIELEAEADPAKAAESVHTIEDQQLRQQAALWVYWKLQASGSDAAEHWLREVPGLDETWRNRILRTRGGKYTYITSPDQ